MQNVKYSNRFVGSGSIRNAPRRELQLTLIGKPVRTPDLTFNAVNDFVHCQDPMYEELQALCLTLAGKLETANTHLYAITKSDVAAQFRCKFENGQSIDIQDAPNSFEAFAYVQNLIK